MGRNNVKLERSPLHRRRRVRSPAVLREELLVRTLQGEERSDEWKVVSYVLNIALVVASLQASSHLPWVGFGTQEYHVLAEVRQAGAVGRVATSPHGDGTRSGGGSRVLVIDKDESKTTWELESLKVAPVAF